MRRKKICLWLSVQKKKDECHQNWLLISSLISSDLIMIGVHLLIGSAGVSETWRSSATNRPVHPGKLRHGQSSTWDESGTRSLLFSDLELDLWDSLYISSEVTWPRRCWISFILAHLHLWSLDKYGLTFVLSSSAGILQWLAEGES